MIKILSDISLRKKMTSPQNFLKTLAYFCCCFGLFAEISHADGKLIGSAGVTQMEGSAGGGIVPWATITGYGTRDEQSSTAFSSFVSVDDYRMRAYGFAHGFNNRTEVSVARLEVSAKDGGTELSENIIGLKVRLFGDLIFTPWPQVAIGAQYKHGLNTKGLPASSDSTGTDFYVAATKVWLDGPFHRTLAVNTTLRFSKANQLGLLGFGGDNQDDRELLFETSVGLFLTRNWIVGGEYRQKPDNFNDFKEDDWKNVFVSYLPNKQMALTAAFVDLGNIGGLADQQGGYISLQLSY